VQPCFGWLKDSIDLRPVEDAQACASEKEFYTGQGRLHDGLLSTGGSVKKRSVSDLQRCFAHHAQKGRNC
jgi:hypothetical protein